MTNLKNRSLHYDLTARYPAVQSLINIRTGARLSVSQSFLHVLLLRFLRPYQYHSKRSQVHTAHLSSMCHETPSPRTLQVKWVLRSIKSDQLQGNFGRGHVSVEYPSLRTPLIRLVLFEHVGNFKWNLSCSGAVRRKWGIPMWWRRGVKSKETGGGWWWFGKGWWWFGEGLLEKNLVPQIIGYLTSDLLVRLARAAKE